MASLCRFRNFSALRKVVPSSSTLLARPVFCRLIHTSDKKKDVAVEMKNTDEVPKTWVSWGFSHTSYEDDRDTANKIFFWSVSVALVGTAYVWAHYPDINDHRWYQREAFLELRRREEAGLPLIDPNYVPPSQVHLPSDEELGSFEIII